MFEYMAAGLPMIATRNNCHLDVVGDGGYVFWAEDPGEEQLLAALRRAWAARGRLAELGQEAYRDVHDWTWTAAARKLYGALAEGLRRHRPIAAPLPNPTAN